MSDPADFEAAARRLHAVETHGVANCLNSIAQLCRADDLFESLLAGLEQSLHEEGDTERVLGNLQRFLEASRSPQSWLALFEREPEALQTCTQLFSASQYLADILISDPEAFDLLRMTGGQPVQKEVLSDEILSAVEAARDLRSVMGILRDYRHRETLRIAYGDLIMHQSVTTVTDQLSDLADAVIEAAVFAAERELDVHRISQLKVDASQVHFAVVALGKLGGQELNYSSDVDLIFVYQPEASRAALAAERDGSMAEYVHRLGQLVIKLLSESTARGIAYRVDMRLRPYGTSGPLATSYTGAREYYDSAGRTWERQAFIKARPGAGNIALGGTLISELQPWIYRRYLMRADITGLAALKRRIERRSQAAGDNQRNVKFGRGGIRDIEFVVQFLQLLHGGDDPSVRANNTLIAIERLQAAGCITAEEQAVLETSYRFLRRVEHRLQIMYDRRTHELPSDEREMGRMARRIGVRDASAAGAVELFENELQQRTQMSRKIVDHLLHGAFGDELDATAETDLILDPEPSQEVIESTLAPFGFSDCRNAYRHLQNLAEESISFLSTRRCRHFLAAIAPKLLLAISKTPRPDATLISLAQVSDSLGGKAVLWELFSANPPTMELCVRLCASSPYLTSILTSNPGMIDELLDSLMLDSLPAHEEMAANLSELCHGAVDIDPILSSFKNSMHLRVGVRDILGKDSIEQTHAALSDIAEVCLEQIIHHEFHRLVHQAGLPVCCDASGGRRAAEFVVLAVGKLGGRDPNYHSDLDVIFLFDGEGTTQSLVPNRRFEPTTNRHFFNQLCQRVIHAVTRAGSSGRLYDLDVSLRPLGRSGELAITIDDLQKYFSECKEQIWERQALCNARPIWGSPAAQAAVANCVQDILKAAEWSPSMAGRLWDHRRRLEQGGSARNLKRGRGGTMDIEFVVQLLQMMHASSDTSILVPGALPALERLRAAKLLDASQCEQMREDYRFLRTVESGIRLMNMSARHDLPAGTQELRQLAYLIASPHRPPMPPEELLQRTTEVRQRCREVFERTFTACIPADEDGAV